MKTMCTMAFVLLLTAAAAIVTAQTRPRTREIGGPIAPSSRPDVLVKRHPIGDLIHLPSNYPVSPASKDEVRADHASVCFVPTNGEQNTSLVIEAITQEITDTIDPDSWKINGGTVGAIQMFGTSEDLFVAQTPENQIAVASLLKEMREERRPCTVAVRAQWLLWDAKDVRAIYDRARKTAPAHATMGPAIVDDATLDRATVYAQGQTTCFNGQTVSIASERERSIVTNVTPIVGAGAVGYSPTTERAKGGVTLQLTPQLSGDDASVVLDVRSVVTETRRPTNDAPTTQPAIDPHDVTRQSIGTTVRLPLGQRVLVAGMTMDPSTAGDGRALYLVVEVDTTR